LIAFVGVVGGGSVCHDHQLAGALLYFSGADYQRKVIEAPTIESDSIIAEQQIQLTQYGWLDREQNKVAIPIDRAMERVVADLQAWPARSEIMNTKHQPTRCVRGRYVGGRHRTRRCSLVPLRPN
jgi:hypothetical protein